MVDNLPETISTGIYYGWASVDRGPVYKMVMSIGWNPFYNNTKKSMVRERKGYLGFRSLIAAQRSLKHPSGKTYFAVYIEQSYLANILPLCLTVLKKICENYIWAIFLFLVYDQR